MNIPLENQNDIYSLGFSKGLQREIPDNSTGVVYDTIEGATNTGSVLSGGNLNLKTLSIGGLVRQVAPGDDIQAAIDAVSREGGGTIQFLAKTYNPTSKIQIKSNVRLVGAGKDITIFDFTDGDCNFYVDGSDTELVKNWSMSGLTMKNSVSTACFDIHNASTFELSNLSVTSNGGLGIKMRSVTSFFAHEVESTANTGDNWFIQSTNVGANRFTLLNCTGSSGGDDGFNFGVDTVAGTGGGLSYFNVINCVANSNTNVGFHISSGTATQDGFSAFIANRAGSNGIDYGMDTAGSCTFIGNTFGDNGGDFNFGSGSVNNLVIGNMTTVAGANMNDSSTPNAAYNANYFLGNHAFNGISTYSEKTQIRSTQQAIFSNERQIYSAVKNSSGGVMPAGAVSIYSATSPGDSFSTTTTNGDTKVCGMLLEATTNTSVGGVLVTGFTSLLYANNSLASISVGDFLSTYSHAYYAKKATAGETAFAIALEAPTTSTAQIDALLISPRLI